MTVNQVLERFMKLRKCVGKGVMEDEIGETEKHSRRAFGE